MKMEFVQLVEILPYAIEFEDPLGDLFGVLLAYFGDCFIYEFGIHFLEWNFEFKYYTLTILGPKIYYQTYAEK